MNPDPPSTHTFIAGTDDDAARCVWHGGTDAHCLSHEGATTRGCDTPPGQQAKVARGQRQKTRRRNLDLASSIDAPRAPKRLTVCFVICGCRVPLVCVVAAVDRAWSGSCVGARDLETSRFDAKCVPGVCAQY